MDSKAVPAVHDGTEPLNEAHTYAERLKRVFAYDKSPETIALDAQMAGGTRGPQTEDAPYTVSVVRYASVTHSPAGWRQARPHWGILVDDTFYHVIVGSNASKPCVLDWSSVDAGEPIDISIPVGTTTMAHRYIVRTLKHIIGHFGTRAPRPTPLRCVFSSYCVSFAQARPTQSTGTVSTLCVPRSSRSATGRSTTSNGTTFSPKRMTCARAYSLSMRSQRCFLRS